MHIALHKCGGVADSDTVEMLIVCLFAAQLVAQGIGSTAPEQIHVSATG